MAREQRAAMAAVLGGVGWVVIYTAWVFVHGSTQSPRGTTLLWLDANHVFGLLAVPSVLLVAAIAWARPAFGTLGAGGRLAHGAAVVSASALALSFVLQTAIVDPDVAFDHPAVQGGWLLYLVALVPGIAGSMAALGLAARRSGRLGGATLLVGVSAFGPIVSGSLHGVADGSLAWDLTIAALDGMFGAAWLAFGTVLAAHAARERRHGELVADGLADP